MRTIIQDIIVLFVCLLFFRKWPGLNVIVDKRVKEEEGRGGGAINRKGKECREGNGFMGPGGGGRRNWKKGRVM